jgi:hypothetical protein
VIVAKTKIKDALVLALEWAPDYESACASVAQSLNVAIESVREVAAEAMAECGGDLA